MRAQSLATRGGEPWHGQRLVKQCFRYAILAVLLDILGRDRGLCSIFGVLGGCPPELLVHNAETSRQLIAVRVVVADEKGRLAIAGYELGDIHGRVVAEERCSCGDAAHVEGYQLASCPSALPSQSETQVMARP